jgi:transglutaminase-like putative cysteine protease
MQRIKADFTYDPKATAVSTPLIEAFEARRGVCQDFAHIMIAVSRHWGVPARYVSGYLYHRRQDKDRSSPDATHAWMEAYLPSFGWVGFDPTNKIVVADRHVRVAVGRDYADVPPTRGTFKGDVESELGVAVRVEPTSAPVRHEEFLRVSKPMSSPNKPAPTPAHSYYQQQQQQQ